MYKWCFAIGEEVSLNNVDGVESGDIFTVIKRELEDEEEYYLVERKSDLQKWSVHVTDINQ